MLAPTTMEDLFVYRLTRLLAIASLPIGRHCEGRYGITKREWRLIGTLARFGRLLSSELAREVHLERARTSKAVTALVAKGLATRRPRPNDRRRVDIELTAAGRALHDELLPLVAHLNVEILSVLAPDEVERLDRMMALLQAKAEQIVDGVELPKVDRRRPLRHPTPD